MKKYILTSPRFTGSVTFGYDAKDNLVFYHNESENDAVIDWLKRHIPSTPLELAELRKRIEGTIREVPPDLTFDTFWETYDKKINKKRVEAMWDRLSQANKAKAVMNIKPYDSYVYRKGIGKAHADKYLSHEYYLVDWNREK